MSRYIDADALKEMIHYTDDFYETPYVEWEDIVLAPTVDAVPVVRCRECKHNNGEKVWLDGDITIDCANGIGYPPPDWFCADGERRTNEQQT